MKTLYMKTITIAVLLTLPTLSQAIVVKDDFTVGAAQNKWTASGSACLTAGNGSSGNGVIPTCDAAEANRANQTVGQAAGGSRGTLPDDIGHGALRLTSNANSQRGSIVYNSTFPTDQGIQVTFTAYIYNGNEGGTARLGADGIGFFLLDGTNSSPGSVGSLGGSLGYSCSNVNEPSDGITGGYIGLGLDEFGNFSTGDGDSTATGPGYKPNSIVLRGGGTITSASLAARGVPSTQRDVRAACRSGTITQSGQPVPILDYPYIMGVTLPTDTTPMAQSNTKLRTNAIPITYRLKITPAGDLSLWYSYNGGTYTPVITNKNILNDRVSGPLPASFRFGFSGGTGGSTNIHEITCFTAAPSSLASNSAGMNNVKGAQVQVGTQIYLAAYHPDNWWGQITASPVVVDTNGIPSISSVANWDGNCNLTGGPCSSLGTDVNGNPTKSITQQAARTILTWSSTGSTGIPFTWNGITDEQKRLLNTGPNSVGDTNGQIRLNYLRGDRTQEQTQGPLRERTGVLGDIIDSSPVWVGPPNKSFPTIWQDNLYPTMTKPETSYSDFVSTSKTRTNMVYIGSNDGMLHGFRAGSYKADGSYDDSSNDGKDLLDYLPASVMANMTTLTDPLYSHAYFTNATPGSGDLFYNNAWHSWVVGGLGAGGKAIYALDVTDPEQFKESKAADLVVGEWDTSTLSELGNTYGTPLIRRLHNGQWAVIFGNGFNSAHGKAGIYIMLVDPTTGARTFQWLDTGSGSSTTPNGIAYVTSGDLDNDHVTDYLYAGDLLGNVWRFDVTSSNPEDWGVSKYGATGATPLFVAKNSNGSNQPITTKLQIASVKIGATNRVMLMFGTGRKIPFTTAAADIYATGTQTIYGIWDWDMSAWNSGTTTTKGVAIPAALVKYDALTTPPHSTSPHSITRSHLQHQTVTSVAATGTAILGYRSLSNNTVCWQGTLSCPVDTTKPNPNTQFGWQVDLPLTSEQLLYNPVVNDGALELNTIAPSSNVASCSMVGPTGWTMAFNPATGGAFSKSYFTNDVNTFDNMTTLQQSGQATGAVMGYQGNGTGTPLTISVGKKKYIVQPNSGGLAAPPVQKNPQNNVFGKRITWEQTK